ncbi:protein-glutamate O-methyltransferase CheR [Halobacillus locisalis]|uniref:protein-glutamate O-methyltransferase n=1 Tax=Halobacillus locisalis TaxID=220753 RepID=A0A838CQG5_9BACI|nr:protein-glutamate O-methyltransferase CheR [Halobacillus locisalis]MBA2173876.1 protein-glutamate O-methyltransferase CheR [Halobacillus locisalis]
MQEYADFKKRVHSKTGIDLSLYKEAQMKRRLTSLRDRRGYSSFSAYFDALGKDPKLFDELLDRMTINVSEFFRNRQRFKVLEKKVIPDLLSTKKRIKVWSAACSTGEEPYTLAMILSQFLPLNQIEIIATDIDDNAMDRARKGVYPERSLKEAPEEMKRKFFTKDGAFYHVHPDIKKCVTFKKHNLLADRYERQCDLIVCRNVLIYFTEEAKETIYQNFSQSLNRGGMFFVGSTEQIFSPSKYGFDVFDTFFYKKR